MATRAPSLRTCGCVVPTGLLCAHGRAAKAAHDRRRPTARQRGYDREYQEAAAAFLRQHRSCTCGAPAVLVRHIFSIKERPDLRLDPSNWLPGCHRCNARDHHRGVVKTSADGGGTDGGQPRDIFRDFSSLEKGEIS